MTHSFTITTNNLRYQSRLSHTFLVLWPSTISLGRVDHFPWYSIYAFLFPSSRFYVAVVREIAMLNGGGIIMDEASLNPCVSVFRV
jgi:hypothetical protein